MKPFACNFCKSDEHGGHEFNCFIITGKHSMTKTPPTSEKKIKLPEVYRGIKSPETLFDMICARNWFYGNLDSNIPVEESREAYHAMKEMILKGIPDF